MTNLTTLILFFCTLLSGFWAGYVLGHGRALAWALAKANESSDRTLQFFLDHIKGLVPILFVLLTLPLQAASGLFSVLSQADFETIAHDGGFFHFRNFTRPNYVHPITGVNTGLSPRAYIESLAAIHGWPLRGIFISADGLTAVPHFILVRDEFPSQTGSPGGRADRLQTEMDDVFEAVYDVPGGTDGDGDPVKTLSSRIKIHIFNYQPDPSVYVQGCGIDGGDYIYTKFNRGEPPGTWWQSQCAR